MATKTRTQTQTKSQTKEAETQPAVEERGARTVTLTLPRPGEAAGKVASSAVNAALLPVAIARQVLPAKGGLPLYLGLGVLGATDVIEWPVAIGIGVGYAVLRRAGPLAPATPAKGAAQA